MKTENQTQAPKVAHTPTAKMTQGDVLAYIKRLYDAGCVSLNCFNEMDRAIFETNLCEAIEISNSHAALVAACEAALSMWPVTEAYNPQSAEECRRVEWIHQARAALALAKGGDAK